jgi:hypothetical protein
MKTGISLVIFATLLTFHAQAKPGNKGPFRGYEMHNEEYGAGHSQEDAAADGTILMRFIETKEPVRIKVSKLSPTVDYADAYGPGNIVHVVERGQHFVGTVEQIYANGYMRLDSTHVYDNRDFRAANKDPSKKYTDFLYKKSNAKGLAGRTDCGKFCNDAIVHHKEHGRGKVRLVFSDGYALVVFDKDKTLLGSYRGTNKGTIVRESELTDKKQKVSALDQPSEERENQEQEEGAAASAL